MKMNNRLTIIDNIIISFLLIICMFFGFIVGQIYGINKGIHKGINMTKDQTVIIDTKNK